MASEQDQKMITMYTDAAPAQVVEKIQACVAGHKFTVQVVHHITETFKKRGIEGFDRQLYIVEVCSAPAARAVLDAEITVANALPCRITVYDTGAEGAGKPRTTVQTMRPTVLMGFFGPNTEKIRHVAASVEESLATIMRESL